MLEPNTAYLLLGLIFRPIGPIMASKVESGDVCSTTTKTMTPLIGPKQPPPPPTPPSSSQTSQVDSPCPVQAVSSSTSISSDLDRNKTLYVGNLGPEVTSNYVYHLFTPYGVIKSWKVIRERNKDAIAFIEYDSQNSAERAMCHMDQRTVMNRIITVNWADRSSNTTFSSSGDPADLTKEGYTVFVGDTGELQEEDLSEGFKRCGRILRITVKRDRTSGRSKHYAFVTYEDELSAKNAIREMNGAWVKNRTVRVNWANNTPYPQGRMLSAEEQYRRMSYDEISKEASLQNMTIFCGYLKGILTEQMLRQEFTPFGPIIDVKCYTDKGYGFVRFQDRSSAIRAIFEKNGKPFDGDRNGTVVKVSWGKENTSFDNFNNMAYWNTWNTSDYGYGYYTGTSAGSTSSGYSGSGRGGGGGAMRRYGGQQRGGGGARPSNDYGYSQNSYPSGYMNHYYGYQNLQYAPYGYGYMCSPTTAPPAVASQQPNQAQQQQAQQPPPGFPQQSASSLLGPIPTTLPYTAVGETRNESGNSYYAGGNRKGY